MISVVIPAYNEEKNIINAIKRIDKYFKRTKYELIIVNDGSKDNTEKLVKDARKKNRNIFLVNNKSNRGKGYAVKNGVAHAKGKEILMIDADLSMSISEYKKLEAWRKKGYDICIGSKKISGAKIKLPVYRRIAGFIFSTLVNLLLIKGIKDTQCGFKLFDAEAARHVFPQQKISGFCFDAEILYIASKKGYSIKEVPITLNDTSRISKVHLMKDSIKMFFDLVKIRLLHR
jgi:dolichyl-phosphate beta-glucosyltransferase